MRRWRRWCRHTNKPMPQPDVSVVIVSFNTRELTVSCLKSVYASKDIESLEVFVVDNASSDGSAGAVIENFPEATLIENTTNIGYAKANNQAIVMASAPYVCLLNSDAVMEPDTLRSLLVFMENRPDVAAAGPKLLFGDGTPQQSAFCYSGFVTEAMRLSGVRDIISNRHIKRAAAPLISRIPNKKARMYTQIPNTDNQPREVESISGACLVVRRDVIDRIGLLDENFFMYMEDIDWCKRMADAGYKIFYLPETAVVHYERMSSNVEPETMTKAELDLYRSRLYFIRKHRGRFVELTLRLIMVVSCAIRWPFSSERRLYGEVIKIGLTGA